MKKNIIIQLTRRFYPNVWWVESQWELLCEEFTKLWYSVRVITKKYDENLSDYELYKWIKIYRFKNIFHLVYLLVTHGRNKNILWFFSHQLYEESLILWILKFLRIIKAPIIWCTHSGGEKSEIMKIVNTFHFLKIYKLIYFFIFQFEYINCLNKDIENQLKKYYIWNKRSLERNLIFIPNWVKEDKLIWSIRKQARRFLYLWRLEPEKWIFETIHAFKKIKNTEIILNIVWYWEAEVEEKVRKAIKSDERIFFLWKVTWKEKEDLFKNSDVFVSPSYYPEWQSIALTEAMVHNLAIISTYTWNNEDLYWKEILYVEKWNVKSLEEQIKALIKNWKKYGYAKIIKKINIKNITVEYIDLLKTI